MGAERIAAADLTTLQLAVPDVDPLLARLGRALPDATVLDPGHVSFGYPWLAPYEAADRIDAVTAALARRAPVTVDLVGPHHFAPDRRGRVTIHLRPRPAAPLHELAAVVEQAAEHAVDDFTPHCSLVRVADGRRADEARRLVTPWSPTTVTLCSVQLHVRHRGRWSVARRIELADA